MNRRQSLDKPAILSPPVQFIVPSPSASPSPRLLQNCSPVATLSHHHHPQQQQQIQLQQSPQQSQHRNLNLSDVVLVTNNQHHHHQQQQLTHDITGRRLSTGSNPGGLVTTAAAGGTILLRQSPSQSPSHNIIFTSNGPSPSSTPTGHEFNTTLVGSNNIALNVKRGSSGGSGGTIFSGGGGVNVQGGGGSSYNNFHANINNRRISQSGHSNNGSGGGAGGGGGGAGSGGASPRLGKRPVSLTQSSPVPSPMASPTTLKQNTPSQSPVHHHQLPTTILTSHTSPAGQPMYQLIQTSAGTQQLIQTSPHPSQTTTVHHRQTTTAMPTTTTFHALPGQQQQHIQIPQNPPPLHQVKATKGPQQILPKPATGIGTGGSSSSNSSNNNNSKSKASAQGTTTNNGPSPNSSSSSSAILTTTTNNNVKATTSSNPPPPPILLPTAQPQLIMSTNHHHNHHQMPMLVQQNTPQGVQFILRQPTNHHQLTTTGPLIMAGHGATNRTQSLQPGQPQQLLRIVNGNGQVQFSPTTTTFIMSSQGNLIQQLQTAAPTNTTGQHQQQQQLKAVASEIQQKLNPIQLGQALNGNLVQMANGQFISQFPAQNFNFTNMNQLVAPANVTFGNGGSNVPGTISSVAEGQSGGQGATIQFNNNNNVMQPPAIHHQIHQQQQNIISPIASPALTTTNSNVNSNTNQSSQQVIGMQQEQTTATAPMIILQSGGNNNSNNSNVNKKIVNPPPVTVIKPKNKKETKKEKAAKAAAAAAATSKKTTTVIPAPVVSLPPPPASVPVVTLPPPPPAVPQSEPVKREGKLDLANVMMLCGIGLDDDDDEDCGMLDTEYQAMDETPGHQMQEDQAMEENVTVPEESEGDKGVAGGDIMITIPGVNSSESIPISFSIPASATAQGGAVPVPPLETIKAADQEVINLDDSWSPQKMQTTISNDVHGIGNSSKPLMDENMCVDTFLNSVLDSQMTPTLQSQIAEIQSQLLGVTAESPKTTTTTAMVQPTTATPVVTTPVPKSNSVSPQKGLKKVTPVTGQVTVKAKAPKKQNSATNSKKQTNASKAAAAKESTKTITNTPPKSTTGAIPMACGLVPSQIGNIQISQVDSSHGKAVPNKPVTSIENQIQITPILENKPPTVVTTTNPTSTSGGIVVTGSGMTPTSGGSAQFNTGPGANSNNMTVTMKTIPVTPQMPKLQPTMMARPQTTTMVQNSVMPSVQINLQAPQGQAPPPGLTMAVQHHPLLSQLTGALSLNLMDDGRLVLKHDANAPQDAQSQMILQTILSGALPNLTLVNESKAAPQMTIDKQSNMVVNNHQPKLIQAPIQQQQQQMQQQPQIRKPIVEPQPPVQLHQQPPQQHILMNQGNILELPKIGPDKQLFKMNMETNQITQISAGSTTALVGPNEQLLIVPADINPQQLAQCQAAGQLQLHNMGHLKPSQPQPPGLVQQQQQQQQQQVHHQQQIPPLIQPQQPPKQPQKQVQVQLKPQSVMPGLVNSATGAPVKNVVPTPSPQTTTTTVTTKKGKKGAKVNDGSVNKVNPVHSTATTARIVPSPQQQVKQHVNILQQSKVTKPPILKNNVMVSKIKGDGANTAVVRPNTIQNHATIKPHTITVPAANKITITPGNGGQQQQQMPTAIMQNLQKNTQIVLPSSAINQQMQQQQQKPTVITQQQQQPPAPRVQTIQLTPQNQQLLKEVQMMIQILSGKLKDKNLLETLTFPIELDESNPINRQPLPTLQNCSTMTDKDIHVALQRLFIEQQKILATGKVIPTISNYSQQAQQQQQQQQSNVMQVPPTVMQGNGNNNSKMQLSSGNVSSSGAAEMVKNWPLMKTQQINEMTIKPIMATCSSTGGSSFPVPNKVINSTTIIPAPVSGTITLTGNSSGMTTQAMASNKKVDQAGTMSITPVVVGMQNQQLQQQQLIQQRSQGHNVKQQQQAVISGGMSASGNGGSGKVHVMTAIGGLVGSTNGGTVVKLEKLDGQQQQHSQNLQIKVKLEQPEVVVKLEEPQQPKGKSPQELAEIAKRIEDRLKYDQECCTQPDTETPFRGKRDAVLRLFGYHCNYREREPEYPEEEVRFQEVAHTVQEGMWSLKQRFQGLLMKGSMCDVATSEHVMIERMLKSDIQQEITDLKVDIERLKNPEPPPLVQIKQEPPPCQLPPPPLELFKPISAQPVLNNSCNNTMTGLSSQGGLEDDTTRTSMSDSRSMCDVKSESGRFGWNDEWSDEEDSSSVARLGQHQQDQNRRNLLTKMKGVEEEDNSSRGHIRRHNNPSSFDIESEILPNFILNMKKNVVASVGEEEEDQEKPPKKAHKVPRLLLSPVSSVKSEVGYDEWTSIQKELANMDRGDTPTLLQDKERKSTPIALEKPHFDDFDKLKKQPWSGQDGVHQSSYSTTKTIESNLNLMNSAGNQNQSTISLRGEIQSRQALAQTSTTTAMLSTTGAASFFSLESNQSEPESWLDFQHHNNSSFDPFPIGSQSATAAVASPIGLMNGSVTSQKRSWNGMVSDSNEHGNSNGSGGAPGGGLLNGGGVDEFNYAKKMCYVNGDFDFNDHLMMAPSQSQQAFHSQAPTAMHNGTEHQQQTAHSQNFDEDINRQVQSAIDSILNMQGSDATDFHFNLDPAMGALLGGGGGGNGAGGVGSESSERQGENHHHHGGNVSNNGGGGFGMMTSGGQGMMGSGGHPALDEDGMGSEEDEQQRAIKSVLLS